MIAAAAGGALGLFAGALAGALASRCWPGAAFVALALCALVGGLTALAVAALAQGVSERLRRRAPHLVSVAALSALVVLLAVSGLGDASAAADGPAPLPPWLLAAAAVPFALVAAVVTAWCGGDGAPRLGRVLGGAGAGLIAAALLSGAAPGTRGPWLGARPQEVRGADGEVRFDLDRGLSLATFAPARIAPLPWFPPAGADGRVEVLVCGLGAGELLAAVLARPEARLTIVEEDRRLVAAALRSWPALAAARAEDRVRLVDASPRWALRRATGRFGLIVLDSGWSAAAHRSHTLNLAADELWTAEAFRDALRVLAPEGVLIVRRDGVARVLTTLREASGLAPRELADAVVVFGRAGELTGEVWHSPAWAGARPSRARIKAYVAASGTDVLYRPTDRPRQPLLGRLLLSERVRGWYFATPLDLSPPLDERPFFDHLERVVISPVGPLPPEEPQLPAGQKPPALPLGDRGARWLLAAGIGAAALILLAARGGRQWGQRRAALAPALAAGACAALALEAFAAWARHVAPTRAGAACAFGVAVLAIGAGGLLGPRHRAGALLLALAAALGAFAIVGYAVVPAALGSTGATLAAGAVGGALGLVLGAAGARVAGELTVAGAGADWLLGVALAAAAPVWVAGRLAATHFGYRLVWALAAVAAAAALARRGRCGAGARGATAPSRPT